MIVQGLSITNQNCRGNNNGLEKVSINYSYLLIVQGLLDERIVLVDGKCALRRF